MTERADDGFEVNGFADPGYEGVVGAFAAGLHDADRTGAALSVWRDGLEVVSVWGGTADHRTGRPWVEDTLQVIFSASKGLSVIVLARLHERGELDLLAPISSVWPEFARHGKGDIAVADVLAHRAGVSAPLEDLTLDDVVDSVALAQRIAAQVPLWTPGTSHAYHAITFGTIVQELVRRVTGRELHEVFAEEIAAPLGADITLKATDADISRVARIVTTSAWDTARTGGTDTDDAWIGRALSMGGALPRALVDGDAGFNDPRVILAGIAGAGGVGTASGLARIWSAVVTETLGVRLLRDDTVALLSEVRSEGPWFFDPLPPYHRWGAGVHISSELSPWFSPGSLGHSGAGGQVGLADPDVKLGMSYVTNLMDVRDTEEPLIAAIREALD